MSTSLIEFLEGAWDALGPDRPAGTEQIVADTFLHERLRAGMGSADIPAFSRGALGAFCFDTIASIGARTFAAALGSSTPPSVLSTSSELARRAQWL